MSGNILFVEDDELQRELLAGGLRESGYHVVAVESFEEALHLAARRDYQVVLADVMLGSQSGIELCARILEINPDVPVIVATAYGSMETAVAAIRAGAYDFISKPIDLDALLIALRRAIDHFQLKNEVRRLREVVAGGGRLGEMVGESPALREVYALIERVAPSDASVLITGESGTGKELVARAIHERSARSAAPFVAVNCAAMPPTLLESELFGHVRGAFTDARRTRPGLFVQAAGGTLFLDELGELPQEMQAKLLRALQERKVRPVGGDSEVPFDARLVTATNRDLESAMEEGRFRADLYYRINVVHIQLPPLRARKNDILLLAQHFLQRSALRSQKAVDSLSSAAARKMLDYDWPGNVRELENCIERAVALTAHSEVGVDDLPEKVRSYRPSALVINTDNPDELVTLEEMELRYIRRVLTAVSGNKTHAARVLGLDRRSLYRRIERLESTKEPPS